MLNECSGFDLQRVMSVSVNALDGRHKHTPGFLGEDVVSFSIRSLWKCCTSVSCFLQRGKLRFAKCSNFSSCGYDQMKSKSRHEIKIPSKVFHSPLWTGSQIWLLLSNVLYTFKFWWWKLISPLSGCKMCCQYPLMLTLSSRYTEGIQSIHFQNI